MDIENADIKRDRDSDQTDGSGHKVLYSVHKGLAEVSQDVPELTNREDADIEDDEESHKLNRDGAR